MVAEAMARARSVREYELWGELAAGGMASVYLARVKGEGGFNQWVAVKRCHPHLLKSTEFRSMMLEEAKLVARIHHPNVVSMLDVISTDSLCLVMDYVEGGSLAELIAAVSSEGQKLSCALALRITLDMLGGLQAAHALKDDDGSPLELVHRDISPHNILVSTSGVARLADFGIAKARSRVSFTETGQVRGKLAYLAPELLSGDRPTRQVDLYGVGVCLWEMLAGERLFKASNDAELMDRVLRGVVPPLSRFREDVPPALEAIIRKGLARDPVQRYASAADMAHALEALDVRPALAAEVGAEVQSHLRVALEERAQLKARPPVKTVDRPVVGEVLTVAATVLTGPRPGLWRLPVAIICLSALLIAGVIAFFYWPRPAPIVPAEAPVVPVVVHEVPAPPPEPQSPPAKVVAEPAAPETPEAAPAPPLKVVHRRAVVSQAVKRHHAPLKAKGPKPAQVHVNPATPAQQRGAFEPDSV